MSKAELEQAVDRLAEQDPDPADMDFGASPGSQAARAINELLTHLESEDTTLFRAHVEMAINSLVDDHVFSAALKDAFYVADSRFDHVIRSYKSLRNRLLKLGEPE